MNFTTTFEAQIRRNETLAHAAETRLGRLARKTRKATATAVATTTTFRPVAVQIDAFPVPVRQPTILAA